MSSTIVVTGAARGIGAAITKKLLQQGYQVIGIDRQENPEQWEITQKIESSEISRWHGFQQDITDQETTAKLIKDILNKHSVTGLVNAAG
ncbi:SDR family NAD(P)-dependent oxidoreductase, partial [Acinetobacter sp. V2]